MLLPPALLVGISVDPDQPGGGVGAGFAAAAVVEVRNELELEEELGIPGLSIELAGIEEEEAGGAGKGEVNELDRVPFVVLVLREGREVPAVAGVGRKEEPV